MSIIDKKLLKLIKMVFTIRVILGFSCGMLLGLIFIML